jgi:hypothetical protein
MRHPLIWYWLRFCIGVQFAFTGRIVLSNWKDGEIWWEAYDTAQKVTLDLRNSRISCPWVDHEIPFGDGNVLVPKPSSKPS